MEILADELSFLKIWFPTWLFILSRMLEINLVIFFAGYMGDNYLAGIGLGSALPIVTHAFLLGFASIFDVYGPQFCGTRQQNELGRLMVKILLLGCVAFLIMTPLYVAMFYSIQYIPLIGDAEESADIKNIAERFLLMSSGLSVLDYVIEVLFKFFTNHQAMMTVYGFTVILLVVQTIFCYIFVVMFKMTIEGIIFSGLFSRILTIVLSLITMFHNRIKWHLNLRHVFTGRILQNWWEMTKIGVSGGMMLFFTMATLMVSVFLSQIRGRVTVEVMTISLYYHGLSISGAVAIAFTSVLLIGKALGSKDVARIQYEMRFGVANLLAERIVFFVIMFLTRRWYYGLFTKDPAVVSGLMDSGYVFAVMITLTSIQELLAGGILYAFGKTKLISIITVSCSCLVGIPIMIILVFTTEIDATAFFFAMIAEQGVAIVVCCSIIGRLDLSEEIENCAIRLDRENACSQPLPNETDELVLSNHATSDQHNEVN